MTLQTSNPKGGSSSETLSPTVGSDDLRGVFRGGCKLVWARHTAQAFCQDSASAGLGPGWEELAVPVILLDLCVRNDLDVSTGCSLSLCP